MTSYCGCIFHEILSFWTKIVSLQVQTWQKKVFKLWVNNSTQVITFPYMKPLTGEIIAFKMELKWMNPEKM